MGSVLAHMTMSLDGYVAEDNDEVGALFEWYDAGPLAVSTASPNVTFHLDEVGQQIIRDIMGNVGALVCGRHLFDITDGWGDQHPVGAPSVVVTHTPPADAQRWPRTRFVPDVSEAVNVAKQIAGDRDVILASPTVIGQALDLGLLDEIAVSLVPMLMGGGKSYFGALTRAPVMLEDPVVAAGTRATHLRYRVRR
jgi:dihydrofolate reductase